jgi:hypothetical protein
VAGAIGLGRRGAMAAIGVGSKHTVRRAFAGLIDRSCFAVGEPAAFGYRTGARLGRDHTAIDRGALRRRAADVRFPRSATGASERRVQSVHRV